MVVKCSLCTCEDLTSDPQHPSKGPRVAEHACKPSTGEEGRDRLVPELTGWLSEKVEEEARERMVDINFRSPYPCTYGPTCEHMYAYTTQLYRYTYTHSLFILVHLKTKQPVDGKST